MISSINFWWHAVPEPELPAGYVVVQGSLHISVIDERDRLHDFDNIFSVSALILGFSTTYLIELQNAAQAAQGQPARHGHLHHGAQFASVAQFILKRFSSAHCNQARVQDRLSSACSHTRWKFVHNCCFVVSIVYLKKHEKYVEIIHEY